ncbi:MAG: chromosome segregation protein SMC, partial [Thermoplasmata archaeon]
NIADAILFVLGAKSSKVMRAERLTDLIFNGGKKHKNPARYCKVSLVFDNQDRKIPIEADEVILTRMIKRAPLKNDPDNYYTYYYINDKPYTYTAFNDLLAHARLSGSSYNIVQQGDVTRIIEMGGIERRKIIDEIAGISHFDEDIKKAEKEKEEVDGNLDRINVILTEINTQLKQLKKDRDEAFRYKELKDQLYELKAKVALKKKKEVEDQIIEIQHQIESYEREQKKLSEKRSSLKERYREIQEEVKDLDQCIADTGGEEVKKLRDEIESLRREEIKTSERLSYTKEEIRVLKKEVEEHKIRLRDIDEEIKKYKTDRDKIQIELEEKQKILDEKKEELSKFKENMRNTDENYRKISLELAELQEKQDNIKGEIHDLNLTLDRLNKKLESIDVRIAELEEDKSTYEFELKDIEWREKDIHDKQREQRSKIKKLEQDIFEKRKEITRVTEELSKLEREIRNLQNMESKLRAEYEAYQLVYRKYNPAVTEILKARDDGILKGIHGTIAELAHVEDIYRTAVAVAAGNRMQSIVVDDDKAAADAIRYLQKKKLGRATFLPLNKMISGKPRGKALLAVKDGHSHGFAIDIVRFKEEYRGAFWYVFGDTIIVDTLDDARRLMGGVRLVDLQGGLIEASGAMHGGSKPKVELSFGEVDRRRLDEVAYQLQALEVKQNDLSEYLSSLKQEITLLEEELRNIKMEENFESQLKDLKNYREEYNRKLAKTMEQIEEERKNRVEIENQIKELDEKIEKLNIEIETLLKLRREKEELLGLGAAGEQMEEIKKLEDFIENLHKTILTLESDIEIIEKKIVLLEERRKEILGELEEIEKNIVEKKKFIEENQGIRNEYQEKIKTLINVQEQLTGKIRSLTDRRDKLQHEIISIEGEMDKIATRIESYSDLISRARYRLPTLEETIREFEEELKLYSVDIPSDIKLPSIDSLKESIRVVEETMHELEPVNMRALEEYEHQLARKEKLQEDVNHLKEQRSNLLKLVREITSKKEERFYEVFHEINKNFKEIYARLSDGGEAELQLENPDKPFEGGLTIKARPRGKKVLLLSALSGGEKSIASLAFIFAIQRYDPSPFYVLDEVDMFLDGVNAENVSRMVRENSANSQFIVVSLRKVALREADHIYGVTMRADGISELIGDINPEAVGAKGEILLQEARIHG